MHIRKSTASYLSGPRIDTRKVDSGNELDRRGIVRIIGTTMNVHAVNPVLMDAL